MVGLWLVVVGATLSVVGILFGVAEITASRRATSGFLGRARKVYVSGHGSVTIQGSAMLTTAKGGLVPMIDERVRSLEDKVKSLAVEVSALPEKLNEESRQAIQAQHRLTEAAQKDLEAALDRFAADLGRGHARRILTVFFLLSGVALQAAGGVLTTLATKSH